MYESRASINQKNRVNQIVSRIGAGLGDAETQKIIDEYYQPEEAPSSDTVTEMMGWESPRCRYIAIGVIILAASFYLFYR